MSKCRNNGTCSINNDGSTVCTCIDVNDCPSAAEKICGSNRVTFKNICHLKATACKRGASIYVKKYGSCCKLYISVLYKLTHIHIQFVGVENHLITILRRYSHSTDCLI